MAGSGPGNFVFTHKKNQQKAGNIGISKQEVKESPSTMRTKDSIGQYYTNLNPKTEIRKQTYNSILLKCASYLQTEKQNQSRKTLRLQHSTVAR